MGFFDFLKKKPEITENNVLPIIEAPEVPFANITYVEGRLVISDYNTLFVDNLRKEMGNTITNGKTDIEVVELFLERKNIDIEEPKLEVIHAGISDDGRVKMELDWNQAFIKHLNKHGIIADTEDATIQLYLSRLSNQTDEVRESHKELADTAFNEFTKVSVEEMEAVVNQIEQVKPKRKYSRKQNTL